MTKTELKNLIDYLKKKNWSSEEILELIVYITCR